MFGSEILETAIGLAFVYVLLSLTCSVLTESIARVFNMRGATLKRAIRQMVYGVFTPGILDIRFVPRLGYFKEIITYKESGVEDESGQRASPSQGDVRNAAQGKLSITGCFIF